MSRGLVVVDVQNDFCEGGSLAVAGGLQVARNVHDLIQSIPGQAYKKRYATKDWHNPAGHNGGHFHDTPDFVDTWPVHCLASGAGSDLAGNLDGLLFDDVLHKGWDVPAYSGFEAVSASNGVTTLNGALQVYGISEIDVCGIASTHCVKATVLDALDLGYIVRVLSDLTVGVDVDGTGQAHRNALAEMAAAGAIIV